MTFETDQTCIKCPYAVYVGSVLFRSCSLSNRNSVEGSMFIECNRRPELGFFEPSIRATECPVWKKEVNNGLEEFLDLQVLCR